MRLPSPDSKKPLLYLRKSITILVIVGFIISGALLLANIHAATPVTSVEPEQGVISGSSTIGSDPNASGGKYVQFSSQTGWTNRVYHNDFSSATEMADVNAFQSPATLNSSLSPTDTSNDLLQKPTVKSDVGQENDPLASDGKALAVLTKISSYATTSGTATGWTNGRMGLTGNTLTLPYRLSVSLRLTASSLTKSAIMVWPSGGGWPWELDFLETTGGTSLTANPGSRQTVQSNMHMDINGDGQAKEQKQFVTAIDATKYHTYDLYVTASKMWLTVDDQPTSVAVTDPLWIPTTAGYFSIGKALTGQRDSTGRTNDGVYVDWVNFYKP